LIPVSIEGFIRSPNVRGQGDMSEFPEKVQDLAIPGKVDLDPSFPDLTHFAIKALTEFDSGSGLQFPGVLDQSLPFSGGCLLGRHEQDFTLLVGTDLPDKPGRKYTGVVHHQQVSGTKVFGDVPERPVFDGSPRPLEHHEAGFTTLRAWVLSDERGREIKIEFFESHMKNG
jgi:hypothetical protein